MVVWSTIHLKDAGMLLVKHWIECEELMRWYKQFSYPCVSCFISPTQNTCCTPLYMPEPGSVGRICFPSKQRPSPKELKSGNAAQISLVSRWCSTLCIHVHEAVVYLLTLAVFRNRRQKSSDNLGII